MPCVSNASHVEGRSICSRRLFLVWSKRDPCSERQGARRGNTLEGGRPRCRFFSGTSQAFACSVRADFPPPRRRRKRRKKQEVQRTRMGRWLQRKTAGTVCGKMTYDASTPFNAQGNVWRECLISGWQGHSSPVPTVYTSKTSGSRRISCWHGRSRDPITLARTNRPGSVGYQSRRGRSRPNGRQDSRRREQRGTGDCGSWPITISETFNTVERGDDVRCPMVTLLVRCTSLS